MTMLTIPLDNGTATVAETRFETATALAGSWTVLIALARGTHRVHSAGWFVPRDEASDGAVERERTYALLALVDKLVAYRTIGDADGEAIVRACIGSSERG